MLTLLPLHSSLFVARTTLAHSFHNTEATCIILDINVTYGILNTLKTHMSLGISN